MSKFFQDVGDVISLPAKTAYNAVTGNPKGNSIGDIWNNTVGPGNPYQELASDAPGAQLYNKATGGNVSAPLSLPTWDSLGKPGQAFAEHVDQSNKALPEVFQPYAQPAEALVLSSFNPFAGAAFQTAYQGGKQQELNKGYDWGELGKDAASNFGTAAISAGANKLISNANTANAAKDFAASPDSVNSGLRAADNANMFAAFHPAETLGTTAATPGLAATTSSALATDSANALGSIGAQAASSGGALAPFDQPFNSSSQSLIPQANAVQSSGLGDVAYKAAIGAGKNLTNEALTSTLAPEGVQPIGGAFDAFSSINGEQPQSQWGDILNAFGGSELNTANPNGPRVNDLAFNDMVNRLSANNYLQQTQARDTALPAGQYEAPLNTPYSNRLNEINSGTTQSYKDLIDQVNNANRYYGVIDSNPGLTPEQLDAFLQDKSSGLIGDFQVPQDQLNYFDNIRPLGPTNNSLLH